MKLPRIYWLTRMCISRLPATPTIVAALNRTSGFLNAEPIVLWLNWSAKGFARTASQPQGMESRAPSPTTPPRQVGLGIDVSPWVLRNSKQRSLMQGPFCVQRANARAGAQW
jgi:hypothetical protein